MGNQSFATSVLEVADNLSYALESAPQQGEPNFETLYKNLLEGVRMTDTVLHQILARHNVIKTDASKAKFDPHQHEALAEVPVDDEKLHGHVQMVIKPGYKLHGRTLRAAKVIIGKKKPSTPPPQQQQQQQPPPSPEQT